MPNTGRGGGVPGIGPMPTSGGLGPMPTGDAPSSAAASSAGPKEDAAASPSKSTPKKIPRQKKKAGAGLLMPGVLARQASK